MTAQSDARWMANAQALRQLKGPDVSGRLLVEGLRSVGAAVAAGLPLEVLFVAPEFYSTPECKALADTVRASGIRPRRLAPKQFSKLSYKAEGLVAIVRHRVADLGSEPVADDAPVVILDALSDPGNLGSVIRAANAFGGAVVVVESAPKVLHPKSVRASMGALFHTPTFVADRPAALAWIAASGRRLISLIPEAPHRLDALSWDRPTAFVIGNERRGVHDDWRPHVDVEVQIPMVGMVDSLNAATSATLVLWEARRAGAPGLV